MVRPVRHLEAQRRDQDRGRDRRRADVHRGRPALQAGDQEHLAPHPRGQGRAADPDRCGRRRPRQEASRPGPARRADQPRGRRVLAALPAARPGLDRRGPYPIYVDRERALYGSWYEFFPAQRGRDVRRQDARVEDRHLRDRERATPRRRRHGLRHRLPAADPPDRRAQPQGAQQHPDPGRGDPGSPWAIGSKDGGHDAVHPDLGTIEDFDDFVAKAASGRPRGRARPRPAVRARPPVGHVAPRVVHDPRRRLDRLRREPAEEVPGHLPAQLRQRLRRPGQGGAARRAASG